MRFKRYMVFKWYEWDDSCPLDKCEDSFDDLQDAKDKCDRTENDMSDFSRTCIFDRVEGVKIQ